MKPRLTVTRRVRLSTKLGTCATPVMVTAVCGVKPVPVIDRCGGRVVPDHRWRHRLKTQRAWQLVLKYAAYSGTAAPTVVATDVGLPPSVVSAVPPSR